MDRMTPTLQLAAIVALLSSTALRGATPGKDAALRMHLETLLQHGERLDPNLKKILEEILLEWKIAAHSGPIEQATCQTIHAAIPVLH